MCVDRLSLPKGLTLHARTCIYTLSVKKTLIFIKLHVYFQTLLVSHVGCKHVSLVVDPCLLWFSLVQIKHFLFCTCFDLL